MQIGPTFVAELEAAGLAGLPFSWRSDGVITGREALSPEQNAVLDAVIAAHDPLAGLIAEKSAAIQVEFNRRATENIAYTVDGQELIWDADATAIENISGVVLLIASGVPIPNPRSWTPVGSFTPVDITHAELIGLGAAIAARKDALFVVKKAKQAEVAALGDANAVAAYDVMADWP